MAKIYILVFILNLLCFKITQIEKIDTFKRIINTNFNKIIYFSSENCYYCIEFTKVYEKLSGIYEIEFYEFNNKYLDNEFKLDHLLTRFPILDLYLDDKSFRYYGDYSEEDLNKFISNYLKNKLTNVNWETFRNLENFCLNKQEISSNLENNFFKNEELIILFYGVNNDKKINKLSQIKNIYNINIIFSENNSNIEEKAIICRKYDSKILELNLNDSLNTNYLKIKNFVLPISHELNEYLFDKFSFNDMNVLFYFQNDEQDEFWTIMENEILKRNNIYKIFILKKNNNYYNRFYQYLNISEYPSLVLVKKFQNKIKKFKYKEIFEEDEFKMFLNQYESNNLKKFITNEELKQENISFFHVFNSTKYDLMLKDIDNYFLILVYGDKNEVYDSYLDNIGQVYEKHYKNEKWKLGIFDNFKNDADQDFNPILPYLMLKLPNGEISIFLENLNFENLNKFVIDNLEGVYKQNEL